MVGNTFNTMVCRWLATVSLGKKHNTKRFYGFVAQAMLENWNNREQEPATITPEEVLEFAGKVDHYSPSMWNSIVSCLRSITPHAACLKRRAMRQIDFIPPDQKEFEGLLAECDASRRTRAGVVVRFLALTGLRITEARGIRWENVHDDHIQVPKEITKNGKPRFVPMITGLPCVLSQLRALRAGDWVLPRGETRKGLAAACKRAGVPRMTYHSCRHLFATRCIESGVDVPTVARWLGHQDGGALLSKVYFHLLDDHSREMAKKVRIGA